MIRRKQPDRGQASSDIKGFDDFELRLGDVMRGERATMGKSLLDVQRELRIKANYIAAIENADPDAFDTPGFIAGYVRSYARYLGMDPDQTYAKFCAESGFTTAHGMSAEASSRSRPEPREPRKLSRGSDPFTDPTTPFIPQGESFFSRIEPAAIGSSLVLLAVIGGLAYGGYAVLNEVQRVQFAPVENTPDVLADLDPLAGATRQVEDPVAGTQNAGVFLPPSDGMDRLYRPRALDVPVVVSRDAPISTLNPSQIGTFAQASAPVLPEAQPGQMSAEDRAVAMSLGLDGDGQPVASPQVVAAPKPGVSLVAVRPAWVRVQGSDGTILFEKILDAGETWKLPNTEDAPVLRAGMSGSIYFQVDGEYYGPAGEGTGTIRNVALSVDDLKTKYILADLSRDPEAEKMIALAEADTGVVAD
ncbi:helix-turn-helix domain-containing protein [Oceanicola sp. S124]|uniref:helix-turn-helix domain-containing protein n=1 Tax=Oceanicola sp. S124 TaxID=1042378 RepID=UPI000255A1A2|nr:helix-turn-helix domain-containing protein [Oceanicola sp. S124]